MRERTISPCANPAPGEAGVDTSGRELVSICLKAYNQRAFIGEALDGVFAQTYRPLEIVICDDHSTDGTWEIIRERVKAFSAADCPQPPPTIILKRNERNLGNCLNWERCGMLAHGALLIKADGDDWSHPERVARTVEAWIRDGKRAKAISCACEEIDDAGRSYGIRRNISARHPLGACMAWSRDCFDGWPAIRETAAHDDAVCSYRARILEGGELVLDDCLVRYRLGSGETSLLRSYRKPMLRIMTGILDTCAQGRRDLAFAQKCGASTRREILRDFDEHEYFGRAWLDLLAGSTFGIRIRGVRNLWRHSGLNRRVLSLLLCLPWQIGDVFADAYLRLKAYRQRRARTHKETG